jgi:NAD(P)-dependent dehydrogenase (short-subunit alcohol dehydrogenase family)
MSSPTVIITGGGQGIGRATAAHLLEHGYQVVIFEKDEEAGREAADAIQGLDFRPCDVSSEAPVKAGIEEVVDRYGRLDALVNNAGFGITKPIDELSLDEWNRVLGANLTGAFLCAKYAAPHLRRARGAIVNLGSTRAYMSEPHTEAYAASKGGILALTHALAISLGPEVRVNAVSPGWIDVTPYQKASERNPYRFKPGDHEQHPAGRVGTPHDIARLIRFLLDPASGFITGQDFIADGGMTRKMIYE